MQVIKIKANRRSESGKGGASRLRSTGQIPAIAYGKNMTSQSLSVSPLQLAEVLSSERGRNTIVELDVDGADKLTVLLRDYQYHPLTRAFLHADFHQIQLDQEIDVEVPLELTGKAAGIVLGGTLRQVFRKLPLRCLPERVPVKVVYDVTPLGLDGHVAARDLQLPEGVSVRLPPAQTLVSIVKEKQGPEEEQAAAPGAAPAAAKAEPAAADKKGGDKKAPADKKAADKK
ncbi:MAG TPA: 50S ribosomal protein L25 [Polyangiaceae bacterium]|nr:50S ribosomal protein L25 [Polyangiaceae bacterium]